MTTIRLKTNDLVLTATTKPTVASGGVESVEIMVDFDKNWSNYTKSAVFYTSKNPTVYEEILIGGTTCKIPQEVLQDECILYIGLKGINNNTVKTSALIKYKIVPGAPLIITSDPSEDVYNQLLQQNSAIINLFAKINSAPVNTPVKFTFDGRFTAIITVNAPNGKGYGTYIAQGYGASDERLHVTPLQAGSMTSYEISSTEEAVIITCDGTGNVSYGVMMIYGVLPTITY